MKAASIKRPLSCSHCPFPPPLWTALLSMLLHLAALSTKFIFLIKNRYSADFCFSSLFSQLHSLTLFLFYSLHTPLSLSLLINSLSCLTLFFLSLFTRKKLSLSVCLYIVYSKREVIKKRASEWEIEIEKEREKEEGRERSKLLSFFFWTKT